MTPPDTTPMPNFIDSFFQSDTPTERRRARAMARVDEANADVIEAAQLAVRQLPDEHPLRLALYRLEAAQRSWVEAVR